MLNRQRLLLDILRQSGGSLGRTLLVKAAFLIAQEKPEAVAFPFYDFVPYKYGPFSFSLYRDLTLLAADGYLIESEHEVSLKASASGLVKEETGRLPRSVRQSVLRIVGQCTRLDLDTVLKMVYETFPWYASRSELAHLRTATADRASAPVQVYTVGYEGKSVDSFMDGLLRNGIRRILDVRFNPVSRKYGFARSSLADISARLGLEYAHLPQLGIPGNFRTDLSTYDSYQQLLKRYESEILPARDREIAQAASLLLEMPTALLCVERDVNCCHRGRLAVRLAADTERSIVHLR